MRKQVLESVSQSNYDNEFANAVFYLQKKTGMTHREIFGGDKLVEREVEVDRDGVLGRLKDAVFGKRRETKTFVDRIPSMRADVFASYLQIMENEAERRNRERKKQEMRQSMGGAGMGAM